jgi:ankyrin repeat protein
VPDAAESGIPDALLSAAGPEAATAPDSRGWAPVHHAAISGCAENLLLLVNKGADLEARTASDRSVVAMALYSGDYALARLVRGERDRIEENKWSARPGDVQPW